MRPVWRFCVRARQTTDVRATPASAARANPARLSELLNQNARYVFFREIAPTAEDSPPGALGVPLTPGRRVAVDQRYLPLGAPVHIATTWPNTAKPLQRLMLAQDIGGAIRGAVRADFLGCGRCGRA